MKLTARHIRFLMNIWPPFWGAGIRVRSIAEDFREAHVELRLNWFNRNYVGSHFGGSLFAMTDPFYMLMLIHRLGSQYIVWDKESTIRFISPGRSTVHAVFRLSDEQTESIRAAADTNGKVEPRLSVQVVNEHGELIAEIDKTLYVRRKAAK